MTTLVEIKKLLQPIYSSLDSNTEQFKEIYAQFLGVTIDLESITKSSIKPILNMAVKKTTNAEIKSRLEDMLRTINNIQNNKSIVYVKEDERERYRKLLKDLLMKHGVSGDNAKKYGIEMEDVFYNNFKTEEEYRKQYILISQYIDRVGSQIEDGTLKGVDVAKYTELDFMTPEEIEEKNRKDREIEEEHNKDISVPKPTRTLGPPCRRCKSTNTSLTRAQTRSGDEPLTNFIYCLDCGYKLKE